MQIHLSASRTLATKIKRDLGHELPRIASLDGKNIGTQPLRSDTQQIAWQCQFVPAFYRADHGTVIAIEAFSRFTLLIPSDGHIVTTQLERTLMNRWMEDLNYWHMATGAPAQKMHDETPSLSLRVSSVHWRSNTDLSVNGHIADTEQWLRQELEERGTHYLSEDHARDLGWYLNQQQRRAPRGQDNSGSFIPYQRFLTLHERIQAASAQPSATHQDEPLGNVVDLAQYRNR